MNGFCEVWFCQFIPLSPLEPGRRCIMYIYTYNYRTVDKGIPEHKPAGDLTQGRDRSGYIYMYTIASWPASV